MLEENQIVDRAEEVMRTLSQSKNMVTTSQIRKFLTVLCFNTNQFLVLPYFLIKRTYAKIANFLKYIGKNICNKPLLQIRNLKL